ncbi:hypothetical protein [Arsenophonus nasoniae]|uniref:Uncharacterized protein n=1 Tax=Arsenophonus nasoniae TaxID=638 RepID=A0AA95K1I5_9GAMM|nr:hypothetical protein [Arsenophonus nasoniae]WGL95966.1 hypothetical protein QE207_05110 [Arsenophonus nasoniae]WGL96704.1 hypothetical protein QE207_09315 [Arsenophonus nasoniae]
MKKFRKKGQSIYEGFIGMDVIDKEAALLQRLKQSDVNTDKQAKENNIDLSILIGTEISIDLCNDNYPYHRIFGKIIDINRDNGKQILIIEAVSNEDYNND